MRYLWYNKFKRLNPAPWKTPENIPYVAATGLIDSYSQLPLRPDLAFNSLWSATNSLYNDLYLANHTTPGAALTDSKSIQYSLSEIAKHLGDRIPIQAPDIHSTNFISIEDLLKKYIQMAPDKNFHFVAQYVLRGIAVEFHNKRQTSSSTKIRSILIPSSYLSFKKRFPVIHNTIANSTGLKFSALCSVAESKCKTDIDYGINKSHGEKTRKLVHATSIILRQEALSAQIGIAPTTGSFDNKEHWLSFLILPLLYATRNSAAHGNAASRLNSVFANSESIQSSSWTFLFGYAYMSLVLLCQGSILSNDLTPLWENSNLSI